MRIKQLPRDGNFRKQSQTTEEKPGEMQPGGRGERADVIQV